MAVVEEHTDQEAAPPPPMPSSSSAKLKVKSKEDDDKEDKGGERTAKPERVLPESLREVRRAENQEIADWLTQLKGHASIQVAVHRLKPQIFKGKTVKGHIDTVEEILTEDEIRDRWGGGQYQLKVKRRNDQGSWIFMTSTTIDIAGDPRLDNLVGTDSGGGGMNAAASIAGIQADAETRVTTQALTMLERQATEMRDMMMKRDPGMDPKLLEQMMKPLDTQLKALQEELRRKDEQMRDVINKPPDGFQQKLLEKFVDGDSARIDALRTQHESELRVLKENHAADLKRLEDRFDRDRSELKRDHDRALDNMKNGYERELATLRAMHAQLDIAANGSNAIIKSSLERDIARIERENAELRAENKALREKKDQSLLDKAKEVEQFKEMMGVGDDEDVKKSGVERVLDTALQSKELFDFANKWFGPKPGQPANGQQPQPQQQQLQQRPQRPPRYVRNKQTGQVGEWDPSIGDYRVIQRRPGPGQEADVPQIPPEQLQMAISILERSYANRTKPANFAATISTALPPEIFQAIRDHGVDGFVNKVAKLGASSPLRRQDGINWLREVGKHLLGEDDAPTQTEDDEIDDIDDDALNDAPLE